MTSKLERLCYSEEARLVENKTRGIYSEIWFQSDPVDPQFCARILQLQLITESRDQGKGPKNKDDQLPTISQSWFEVAILADENATEPRQKDGHELSYRSHCNKLRSTDLNVSCYGNPFDRRDPLLTEIEPGNVIAVRMFVGEDWVNEGKEGQLHVQLLDIDPSTVLWTLKPTDDTPMMRGHIKEGLYSLTPAHECVVEAYDAQYISQIWFTTPVLTARVAPQIQEIQLFTTAENQRQASDPTQGMWTWFDVIVLESPKSDKPKTLDDGRALVWRSHDIHTDDTYSQEVAGPVFDKSHELLNILKAGDVIAIRVNARFPAWTAFARDARLVVRIAVDNEGIQYIPPTPIADWKAVADRKARALRLYEESLGGMTPGQDNPATSIIARAVGNELRMDDKQDYGARGKPLKVLSLDGGGVRGISSLYILKEIMNNIPEAKGKKPCEYFDVMAGTSTGGLIAIMLGRLEMSIDDCITQYGALSKDIFPAPVKGQPASGAGWFSRKLTQVKDFVSDTGNIMGKMAGLYSNGALYDEKILTKKVKEIVAKFGGNNNPDEKMFSDKRCKVFALACYADSLNNKEAAHLRTYYHEEDTRRFDEIKIWEAARATSAAPAYFNTMQIGDAVLVDGGLGHNNPIISLLGECLTYFGCARPIGCAVTIGTGMKPNLSVPNFTDTDFTAHGADIANLYKRLADVTTDAEQEALKAQKLFMKGTYFRALQHGYQGRARRLCGSYQSRGLAGDEGSGGGDDCLSWYYRRYQAGQGLREETRRSVAA